MKVKSLSHVWPLATPWAAAYQAPPSMGFSRQEYWSGVPLPSPYQSIDLLNFNCNRPVDEMLLLFIAYRLKEDAVEEYCAHHFFVVLITFSVLRTIESSWVSDAHEVVIGHWDSWNMSDVDLPPPMFLRSSFRKTRLTWQNVMSSEERNCYSQNIHFFFFFPSSFPLYI